MYLNSTHFKILKCLKFTQYSFRELVLILNISEFKIRKYIKDLEYFFKVNGLKKIHEELQKYPNKISDFKKFQEFIPSERQAYIFLNFLFYDVLNLTSISLEMGVTRRTVANDILFLKKFLKKFSLEIESIPSIGIKLIGSEVNKRKVFELYTLKILIEEQFLPDSFKKIIAKIEKLLHSSDVKNIIRYIFNTVEQPRAGIAIRHIEILIIIAIIRKNISDPSLIEFKKEIIFNDIFLNNFLDKYNFFSNYEKNLIKYYLNLRSEQNIFTESHYIKKIKNLVELFNKELNLSIDLEKDTIIKLYSFFKSYDFKKSFNINEFYMFRKNLSKEYINVFEIVKNIILLYFKDIDSLDLISITSLFIELLNKNLDTELKKIKNFIIVYDALNPLIIIDLCKKLDITKFISNTKFIYKNNLKCFQEQNKIDYIITFEDLSLPQTSIKEVKFSLPIISLDKLKLMDLVINLKKQSNNQKENSK